MLTISYFLSFSLELKEIDIQKQNLQKAEANVPERRKVNECRGNPVYIAGHMSTLDGRLKVDRLK